MNARPETKGYKASMKTAKYNGNAKKYAVGEQLRVVVNTDGSSNCGFASKEGDIGFFSETGPVMSWAGKNIPGIEGTSKFHDIVTSGFTKIFGKAANGIFFNVPSMSPLYAINALGTVMVDQSVLIGLNEIDNKR